MRIVWKDPTMSNATNGQLLENIRARKQAAIDDVHHWQYQLLNCPVRPDEGRAQIIAKLALAQKTLNEYAELEAQHAPVIIWKES